MSIQGAIFDVDGTLLDSMSVWMNLGKSYLLQRGIEPEANLGQILFAMTMEQGARYLIDTYHLQESVNDVLSGIMEIVKNFYFEEVQLKTGARELLEHLQTQKLPCAVATASEKIIIEKAFERLGILKYFCGILTCSEIGEGKESAKIYLEAAKRIGAPPEKIVVFEDAVHALKTAKDAGFKTVGVYDAASEEKQPLLKSMADFYGRNFEEILDKFKKEWK